MARPADHRRGYWWKKTILIVVTLIIGAVLALGGLFGAGFIVLTKVKTGDVLGDKLELSDAVAELSLLNYASGVIDTLSKLGSSTIGDIEDAVGYRISKVLNNMMGTPVDALRAAKIGDLPETIMNYLTLISAQEKFGISFPDLPIFQDEEFLQQPLTTAFESMADYPLDCFVSVVYDEDATEATPASSKLLQKLGKLPLSEVSADMQGVIDDSTLREMVEPGTAYIWEYLADKKLSELGDAMDNMLLSNAIKMGAYDEDGNPLDEAGHALVLITGENGNSVWGYYDEDGAFIQAEQARGNTHIVLWKLKNSTIDGLGENIDDAIADTKIGEMIEIGDDAPQLLKSLADVKLNTEDLTEAIDGFTIENIYKDANAGILGLVSNDTKLNDLPSALAISINDAVLYRLHVLGVINVNLSNSKAEVKSRMYNRTAAEIINSYITLMSADSAEAMLAAINNERTTRKVKLEGNELTPEIVAQLGIRQGDTVVLTQNTTIPADSKFEFAFNIMADYDNITVDSETLSGTYTLTIGENVTVDGFGYMYIQTASGNDDFNKDNIKPSGQIETAAEQNNDDGTKTEAQFADAVFIEFIQKGQ